MRRLKIVGLSLAVGLAFTASPLQAQDARRDGFWGSIGASSRC